MSIRGSLFISSVHNQVLHPYVIYIQKSGIHIIYLFYKKVEVEEGVPSEKPASFTNFIFLDHIISVHNFCWHDPTIKY